MKLSRFQVLFGLSMTSVPVIILWYLSGPPSRVSVQPHAYHVQRKYEASITNFHTRLFINTSDKQLTTTKAPPLASEDSSELFDSAVTLSHVVKSETSVTYHLLIGLSPLSYTFPLNHTSFTSNHRLYRTFKSALRGQSNVTQALAGNKTIILAVVDLGYLDLAINLYLSSFLKHNISNYLFVCSENTACDILNSVGIASYSYVDYSHIGRTASSYFSKQFKKKTHVKTMAILDALKLGYEVLITDIDIVFIKNPFPYFKCKDCDMEISSDDVEGNSGFYLAHQTKPAIKLHEEALRKASKRPELSNQKTLDRTLEYMSKNRLLKYVTLPLNSFPNGVHYFERGHRMWPTDFPCQTCVILHNNWIVSNSAKVYRFKEHGHWLVDKNQYFSDANRKYIVYSNKGEFADYAKMEYDALKSAFWIAYVLNRTLILPQFHKPVECKYEVCKGHNYISFNGLYHVPSLDKHLGELYRESWFLSSSLVPDEIRRSSPHKCIIDSILLQSRPELMPQEVIDVFHPQQPSQGASMEEILHWFNAFNSTPILHFASLYESVNLLALAKLEPGFAQRLDEGLKSSDYRQYHKKSVELLWIPAKTVSGSIMMLYLVPVFVIPVLCLTICCKIGICDLEEDNQPSVHVKQNKRYNRVRS